MTLGLLNYLLMPHQHHLCNDQIMFLARVVDIMEDIVGPALAIGGRGL